VNLLPLSVPLDLRGLEATQGFRVHQCGHGIPLHGCMCLEGLTDDSFRRSCIEFGLTRCLHGKKRECEENGADEA
jgi:hypothetical protein